MCVLSRFSRVQLSATIWTVAHQAPLSMEFSRQEYWGGLPCPPPGDLPNPGIEPRSLMSPALAGGFFTTSTTCQATYHVLNAMQLLKVILTTADVALCPVVGREERTSKCKVGLWH